MYSRITVEEVANVSNDKVELEITAQLDNLVNYLYTVFRICCRSKAILVDAASVNYNRMIGMVQERLHSYDYKLNLHANEFLSMNQVHFLKIRRAMTRIHW